MLVFDKGDNYLKCYKVTERSLRQCWREHARNFVTMATDATNILAIVAMKTHIEVKTFSGETISTLELKWGNEIPRDIAISDKHLAVCIKKEVRVYNIISTDDSHREDN